MKLTPLQDWIGRRIGSLSGPLTREALETYQLSMLRNTVAWARDKSPFYKKHLVDLSENDLVQLDDLDRFPFTTRQDLGNTPRRLLCVSQGEISHVVTLPVLCRQVKPRRVYLTSHDLGVTVDFFACGLSSLVKPGDLVLSLFPRGRPGGLADLILTAVQRLGAVGRTAAQGMDLREPLALPRGDKVNLIIGPPVQVLILAEQNKGRLTPESVMLSGERLSPSLSQRLVGIWDCQVYSHYGMTEMGFGGGVECSARQGYHMRESDLFFEIVSPQTGRPTADGEEGEIVFTTLTRQAMPLIRYRTGDISRFLPGQCHCGTVLRTMARVQDQLHNRIVLGPGCTLSMADLDDALFPIKGLMNFQAKLETNLNSQCLQIEVNTLRPRAEGILNAVNQALQKIPAVKAALRKGNFRVKAKLSKRRMEVVASDSKRNLSTR